MGAFGNLRLGLGLGAASKVFVGDFDAFAGQLYAVFGPNRALSSYSGPCWRVRRSIDSVEHNIGFDYYGWVDASQLLNVAAGGSLTIVRDYDKTGNGRDALQTTSAAQPRCVLNGVLDVGPNGKPCAVYSAAQFLEVQNARGFVRNAAATTVAANVKATAAGGVFWSPRNADTFSREIVGFSNTTTLFHQARADDNAALSTATKTVTASAWLRIIARARFAAGGIDLVTDGGTAATGVISPAQASANTDAFQAPRIGAGASGFVTGQIGTVVLARAELDPALTDAALIKTAP